MNILAIDPGTLQSAWVLYDSKTKAIMGYGIENNETLLLTGLFECISRPDRMAIEMIASYGMPVGRTVFDTCVWIGRFIERWDSHKPYYAIRVYRNDIKMFLCGSMRAKESNIRQAIIDRYEPIGGGAIPQIGTIKQPGPLYGISKDKWSAIAVAITYTETILKE